MATEDVPPGQASPGFTPPQPLEREEQLPAAAGSDLPPTPIGGLTAEEKQWAMFCHLSSLLGLLAGGFTFIGPLICWMVKKDTSRFVDEHGKESVNFQLNILIYFLIGLAITVATCGIAFPLPLIVVVYGIVMPIIAGMKANNGEPYQYPFTLRILK